MTIAAAPSGRLITKIHRHDAYWASDPPSVGPKTAEIPHTLDSQPWTRPRSSSRYRSPASVFTVAMIVLSTADSAMLTMGAIRFGRGCVLWLLPGGLGPGIWVWGVWGRAVIGSEPTEGSRRRSGRDQGMPGGGPGRLSSLMPCSS